MKDWRGNYEDLSVHHLLGHQRTGCWVKPRAGQPQNLSPCPRAPARPHVRLSDTPRTGRAAEDVGPCHPSCPDAARHAKVPRRPRRGTFERARRGTSQGGRVAIHCDWDRKASCRSTRSARRHEGTEEVESWFTHTSVMDCLIPRPGMAQSLSDAPRRGRRESFARRAVRRRGGHRALGFRGGRGGG